MYEIVDYDILYKPTDSKGRDLVHATYVKMPVKPRGKGIKALLKHKNGIEIFGIWSLLLEAATDEKPENRGKFLNHREEPATIEEIAESISLDGQEKKVEAALSALVAMNWIQSVQGTEEVRTKYGQGTEEVLPKCSVVKSSVEKCIYAHFEKFFDLYPRKIGKKKAQEAWAKLNPDEELVEKILAAVAVQKKQPAWLKDDGQFIPHPTTWLNQGRWDDVVGVDKPKSVPAVQAVCVVDRKGGRYYKLNAKNEPVYLCEDCFRNLNRVRPSLNWGKLNPIEIEKIVLKGKAIPATKTALPAELLSSFGKEIKDPEVDINARRNKLKDQLEVK